MIEILKDFNRKQPWLWRNNYYIKKVEKRYNVEGLRDGK